MKTNPIQQIITSTSRFDGPYLLLVQHSLAFSQRHSAHVDGEIYKRANVRTPSQNACRDSMGSALLEYIVERYVAATGSVLWVETNQTVGISMSKSIRVLSAAVNPFGWDGPEGDTLENLENLYDSIVACTSPEKSNTIVFESMTPILIRHGLETTIRFLRKVLINTKSTVVAPILMESLSAVQHRALEDMAQAALFLHGGDLTLIRKGVRERGNTVREIVPFSVDVSSGKATILITNDDESDAENPDTAKKLAQPIEPAAPVVLSPPAKTSGIKKSGKILLQMDDDVDIPNTSKLPAGSNKPNIFIQDDDPEYDDLDEEDPDDDLDI